MGNKAFNERWPRRFKCGLCEQEYHGVVSCALGWACWKTYVGLPEANWARRLAIGVLGTGLSSVDHNEDALSVKEAALSMEQRLGAPENNILIVQTCLANSHTTARQ